MFGIKELRKDLTSFKCALVSRNERIEDGIEEIRDSVESVKETLHSLSVSRNQLIEQKIPENLERLNSMILDLKGLVSMAHADANKNPKVLAAALVSEVLNSLESKFTVLQKYIDALDAFVRHVEKNGKIKHECRSAKPEKTVVKKINAKK